MGDVVDLKNVGQKTPPRRRRRADGPTRLTTERGLFRWLFERPDDRQPRIAVDEGIARAKEDFLDAVSDAKRLRVTLCWQDLFQGIKWDNVQSSAYARCGVELLQLLAAFGSAARPGHPPSRAKMIGLMVSTLDPDGSFLTYRCAGRRWTLESTPECTVMYGVEVRVALPNAPNRFSRRDLDDWDEYLI